MSNNTSLVNLGELSKPATVLVEKISDAVGGIFKPYQIRRVARAEAEANKIRAAAQIEITELQHRALRRFVVEEAKKQNNMESITAKALTQLEENASPQDVEDDWITNFFDKCRLISDEEMQVLWAKVLAGEANAPGKYSRRTVSFLSSMDKSDAFLFTRLCGFAWTIAGDVRPLVYDVENKIYKEHGITFEHLKHLDEIGLLTFEHLGAYQQTRLPEVAQVAYYRTVVNIKFEEEEDNKLELGHVLLSKVGEELAPICGSEPVTGFIEFVLANWIRRGLVVYSDWPRQASHPTR
jgi:hypothetical protein